MSPVPTKKITVPANLPRTAVLLALLVAAVAVVVPALDSARTDAPSPGPGPADGPSSGLERRLSAYAMEVVADSRFRPPDRAEREALAEGVGLYVDGEHEKGERRLAEVDFGVRIVRDTPRDGEGPGRRYAEIADRTEETRRGWGRVYIDLDTAPRYSVQVPHPVADAYTDRLGAGVLRSAPGGILVIAGAHRRAGEGNAADVAHRRDTVFHAIAAELVDRSIPGIQVHGYADSTVPGRDLVISTGAGDRARSQARTLAGALDADGFQVCRAWEEKCPLEGRNNKQGRLAADEGVPFLHIEVNRTVRGDAARTDRAVAAMAAAVREWGAGSGAS
ncbi:hypothetical protein GCM10011583_49900 [Streptomyces camponoticapitis]|uniref:N-acetylmuramoyl-L-alanine amidase n=1 Tax=Streptomyces camponoticapitis TaxID=1616125 RepID=A0ABQ2EHD5_9ACTN|nr:hypothetical protein [Streptomyces camponoticapitis]GGK11797.1 hypothetical protein GCM10011583_49900 [Streptomyces camponoticapitis]